MSQVVLITGCSTGIGRDLAGRLARAGHKVVATARKAESLEMVEAALRLPLDVTQTASVDNAVDETLRQFGRIDILVNNAGYALRGAVEEISDEQVRRMFDVNVYGVMRMVRAVAPHMRQQKAGRIVNIGSIGGRLVAPVNGTYSATKFALEALSDALRMELLQFGIQVVLVEPGNIRTSFMATAESHAREVLSNAGSPYHALYQQYVQVMADLRQHEPGPEVVSQVVQQAIKAGKPRARYRVAVPFSTGILLYLGDSVRDFILKRTFKITSPAE